MSPRNCFNILIHHSPYQSVYSVPVYGAGSNASTRASNASNANATNTATITQLQTFLSEFRVNEAFVYRDRLRANLLRKEYTLEVEMSHLIGWNEDLAARCRTAPGDLVPLVSTFDCLSHVQRLTATLYCTVRSRFAQPRPHNPVPQLRQSHAG